MNSLKRGAMSKLISSILNSNSQTSIIKVEVSNSEVGHMSVNVWFTGCRLSCHGCHNSGLKDKQKGMTLGEAARQIYDRVTDLKIKWVVFTGGNPPDSPDVLAYLLYFAKELGANTLVYMGYTINEFKTRTKVHHMRFYFENCDLIKTGAYKQDKHEDSYYYASTNQELHYLSSCDFTCIYKWDASTEEPVIPTYTTDSGEQIPSELYFFK
jgi:organic radical activating enzyme